MDRKLKLIGWVKAQHEGQLIRKTKLPYFQHVLAVAAQVAAVAPLTYEMGLCHDLLEKTGVTPDVLSAHLIDFGYCPVEAEHIRNCVEELTRRFTKANTPLPKKQRKVLEDARLQKITADAQSVKYADFSYNADWMMAYDRRHAADYLERHLELIGQMKAGDADLREMVLQQFRALLAQR